ncbi:hypothetical protein [Mucilaginibacter glaciei]|uniref:Uncharacterized protein n=1 Tax=Mucilaginibacter glaciei TaxID=2772109 RepID=A0A926NL07_9SPHI|nr:hypothetical protein [Mucilaginibacter glaciei]MBD1393171.1 hypothetical protein [Mucilaginibacter glaciei]
MANQLIIYSSNSIFKKQNGEPGGVDLNTIRKRLTDTYHEQHDFHADATADKFTIQITLILT